MPYALHSIIIHGDVIPESGKLQYLGHNDLSDDEDTMRLRRHVYDQGYVISRSFHMCSIAVILIRIRYFVPFEDLKTFTCSLDIVKSHCMFFPN